MAEAFARLWTKRPAAHAPGVQGAERGACGRVQRLWRGQRVRSWVASLTRSMITVQRAHRGARARTLVAARRAVRARREARAVYHYHATLAQRSFRGFYSRRYRHDFRARRRYVDAVAATGEALRARLERRAATAARVDAAEDDARRAAALAAACGHLHHLVSTASAPGVYAAPTFDPGRAPAARGAPLEAHLRAGVRGALALRRRRWTAPPPAATASLRAAAPYDAPRDAARLARRVARAGFVGAVDFNSYGRARPAPYKKNSDGGFLDPWLNPYLKRGVPRGAADLTVGCTTLGRAPHVPFFPLAGNTSTVHANGLFDVIERASGVAVR